jgi:hypothetical protein
MARASLCRVRAETCRTIELLPIFGGWKRPGGVVVEATGFDFTAGEEDVPVLRVPAAPSSVVSGLLGDDFP